MKPSSVAARRSPLAAAPTPSTPDAHTTVSKHWHSRSRSPKALTSASTINGSTSRQSTSICLNNQSSSAASVLSMRGRPATLQPGPALGLSLVLAMARVPAHLVIMVALGTVGFGRRPHTALRQGNFALRWKCRQANLTSTSPTSRHSPMSSTFHWLRSARLQRIMMVRHCAV